MLIFVLIKVQTKLPPKANSQNKVIKSYLYKKPLAQKKPAIITEEKATEKEIPEKASEQLTEPQKIAEKTMRQAEPTVKESPVKFAEETPKSNKKTSEKITETIFKNKHVAVNKSNKTSKFNPYKSLQKLSSNNTKQHIEEALFEYNRKKSASVMHGAPALVPERVVEEEKDEKASQTQYGHNTIIKGDDGSCTLVQDLSHQANVKWVAVQSFACGESKMNKAARLHMEKVVDKIKPQNILKEKVTAPLSASPAKH